jgi:hypothetical protein
MRLIVVILCIVCSIISGMGLRLSGFSKRARYGIESALSSRSNAHEEKPLNLAQSIVTGLTEAFVFVTGVKDMPIEYEQSYVTPDEVVKGIAADFSDGYLFSGKIQTEIYNSQCTFRDPTLEFKGLSTFLKNIKSIEPALNLLLGNWLCILYEIKQDKASRQVTTEWRMVGEILLPWRPRLDLKGNTRFTYLKSDLQEVNLDKPGVSSQAQKSSRDEVYRNDGRIISYYETWQIGALDALKQLIRRSKDARPMKEIGRMELERKAVNVYAFDKRSNVGENL